MDKELKEKHFREDFFCIIHVILKKSKKISGSAILNLML